MNNQEEHAFEYQDEYDYSVPYDESLNAYDYTQTFDESTLDTTATNANIIAAAALPSVSVISSEPIPYTLHNHTTNTFSSTHSNYDTMGAVPYPQGYTPSGGGEEEEEEESSYYKRLDSTADTRSNQLPHQSLSTAIVNQDANPQPKGPRTLRSGGGQIWEDITLQDWDPKDYRIFVGDLGRDVSDDALTRAFSKYSSMQKARIVRDRKTLRTKGYGFVSFSDARDFVKALKEMNGKFVGSRPMKLSKSTWDDRNLSVKQLKNATGSTKIPKKKDQVAILLASGSAPLS